MSASTGAAAAEDVRKAAKPVFTQGPTMRHVLVMTATSSIGLVAIFVVDAINLFYIALLGQQVLAAAIGYAATLLFFAISVGIGLSIATAALVARALGEGDAAKARRLTATCLAFVLITTSVFALMLWPLTEPALQLLGARGETKALAAMVMRIVIPSIPLLGLGMALGALLRAKGDPRRAMFVTLWGGAAALVLDPLFIFGFDMGLAGAAWSTVCVRFVLVAVGLHGVVVIHKMLGPLPIGTLGRDMVQDLKAFSALAGPAIVTQLATPVGNVYVTGVIARFGDDAVAGWAIIGRILPVAFGVIFALSGAVGPIMAQNLGAGLTARVRSTLRDALVFTMVYVMAIWAVLALTHPLLIGLFGATGEAAELVALFCLAVAGSFLFNGALFVANAAFNNLGFPLYATVFNWGRATLGVIPFVTVGAAYGAPGVLIGWGLGAIVFGVASAIVAFRVTARLDALPPRAGDERPRLPPAANSPYTSGKGAAGG